VQSLTVSELNRTARLVLDSEELLQDIYVRGELSSVKLHPSGHIYFTLKDAASQVRAVMFRSRAQTLVFRPDVGMDVVCRGRVSIFERDGAYQFYAEEMEPAGVGAQHLALLQLKERLDREGLFDPAKKRPLPLLPSRVGVITSSAGAALHDILSVARRRHPGVSLVVAPVLVQGEGAAASLERAVEDLCRNGRVDVIIIGRGGGSKEDLQAFNDERVVRAVASSTIPIVSAVGHEIDTTLTDYAADRRAPTPSAAAELAVPVRSDLLFLVHMHSGRLAKAERHLLSARREEIRRLAKRRVFLRPRTLLDPVEERLSHLERRLSRSLVERLLRMRGRLSETAGRLEGLSPLGAIGRGFAIIERDGRIVRSAREVSRGEVIRARLSDGHIRARVEEVDFDV